MGGFEVKDRVISGAKWARLISDYIYLSNVLALFL